MAEVQKAGGEAAFIDAEHALDPVYAKAIGVRIDDLLVSQPDDGEQALEITEELIRSDAPATKQQEREALDKIRKIVEQLGPDSYLATTFEGCFDLAAENINNDWACSMADRARRAEKRAEEAEEKRIEAELGYNRLVDKLAEAEKDYEAAHAAAHAVAEEKDAEIAKLKARIQELLEDSKRGCESIGAMASRAGEAQRRAEAAEAEVIRLKAKLYDYMTREG